MAGEGSPFGLEGGLTPELTPAAAMQAGKITPYVVVTGLIPTLKQQQEFERRFGSASFRDPRRDQPQWAVYLVERAQLVPGGTPRWVRLEVKDAARADRVALLKADLARNLGIDVSFCGTRGHGATAAMRWEV